MRARKKVRIIAVLAIIIILMINVKTIGKIIYPIKYENHIKKYSAMYNIDPYMVAAIIKVESNYDKNALSKKKAIGLMQLTPSTAREVAEKMDIENFTPEMILDPELNIKMGCWYIDNLKKEFGNNMELVLAAYNGGRGNVKKWLKNRENSKDGQNLHYIPFKETDKYVKKVKVNHNIYKYLYSDKKHNLLN
ncbi:lytic transglycosylase domain-containing protein [Clostridium sp. MB40-C1]|uniref:lytic transglycosylase domain-containing protein n=1 Tax=Clostridium sp. MB40-C1 TaxID=3070996 RepID=UPI0027E1A07C|nr:lytic transglycosylase domain-containing protein [Clostridium sp. MB40-C1]WMJ81029.1 lytic transglycosylase domain-containing protein [Clostridium sp. MB40-C1]